MAGKRTVVKKVSPYPIAVDLKNSSGMVIQGRILKLTDQGFLADVQAKQLKPGERFEFSFEFPVLHLRVSERGILVKLYNQLSGAQSAASGLNVIRLIEIHFENLSDPGRESISTFLRAINKQSE